VDWQSKMADTICLLAFKKCQQLRVEQTGN